MIRTYVSRMVKPNVEIAAENRFKLDENFVSMYRGKQPNWTTLGYVTYLRTYSRPKYDSQGKSIGTEEFSETLERVVNGTFSFLKQQIRNSGQHWSDRKGQEMAQIMFTKMWDFKFLPPGRGMWMMGTEYIEKYGGGSLNNCAFRSTEFIDEDFAEPFIRLMDFSMVGMGVGFDTLGAGKVVIQKRSYSLPLSSEALYTDATSKTHVVEDSREGWMTLVERVLLSYVGHATYPTQIDYSRIRPEGAPIRGFGGKASGPKPLQELVQSITELLDENVGKPISSTIIVDIMNLIGRCIVSGNVRRSSEIALSPSRDSEFLKLKDSTEVRALSAQLEEISCTIPEWVELQEFKMREVFVSSHLDMLDPDRIEFEKKIRQIEEQQFKITSNHLEWRRVKKKLDNHPLVHHRWASNNTVLLEPDENLSFYAQQTAQNGEPGYGFMDVIRAFGRLCDAPNFKDKKAKGFNPCGEQSLWDGEICCLLETFPTKHETLEEYLDTLKYAYLYAKVVTCILTHNSHTNAIVSRNRRIGTSMAGVAKMYLEKGMQECVRWWDAGYKFICELDEEYSGWMGIPVSIKHTSIKPGGTIPLVANEEGGMKFVSSEYYFRTIRIDNTSPLIETLLNAGYRVEPDVYTPRSMVVYFPIHNPMPRYAPDISIWEQMALAVALQAHWSDNMVSATITFKEHEKGDIARVLDVYRGKLKAVSFLPYSDHGYMQAPYIPCTKSQYESAVSLIKPLQIDVLGVVHDVDEKFCDGDKCLLTVGAE